MAVLNSLHEKYKGQVEMKFSASYQHMRNAIHSKKKFRTEDIWYIVECLNEEFERFDMSRLKWTSKPNIERGCVTSDFPLNDVFI